MKLVINHSFVSLKSDPPDPTVVKPSDWNDAHEVTGSGWFEAGMVIDFVGHTVPDGYAEAYGQSLSAATYPDLFGAMVKQASVTLPLATPGVVNWNNHGLPVNSKVRFRTDGVLPTGVTANVDYYVIATGLTPNSFRIAATPGGSAISFTVASSGNHTGVHSQFGVATDLSTFTVPDLRGRATVGYELMGGTTSGRLTSDVNGTIIGETGGAETITLVSGEMPPHVHNANPPSTTSSSNGDHTHANTFGVTGTNVAAGGHTHAHALTVSGTVASDGAHTHANTLTVSGTNASDGAHTHANTLAVSGTVASNGSHTHGDNFTASGTAQTGGSHTHTWTAGLISATLNSDTHSHGFSGSVEVWDSASGGGSHSVLQPTSETGGTAFGSFTNSDTHTHTLLSGTVGGTNSTHSGHTHTLAITISGGVLSDGAHTHGWSGSITGGITSGGTHTHTWSGAIAGGITSGGAHTHGWTGAVGGTITAVADHTHSWSGSITGAITSGGAHTHTVDIAAFDTASTGGGGAHNNMQPSIVVRKLIYHGVS